MHAVIEIQKKLWKPDIKWSSFNLRRLQKIELDFLVIKIDAATLFWKSSFRNTFYFFLGIACVSVLFM